MNIKTFKNGMGALLQAYPDRRFDNDIFYTFLNDLKDDDFLRAVSEIISTQKEIYPGTHVVGLIREKAWVDKNITAGEAWAEVRGLIGKVGSYGYPKFSSRAIDKAVSAVGWRDMCLSENIMIERAHFLKIYDSIVKREEESQMMLPGNPLKKMIENVGKKLT